MSRFEAFLIVYCLAFTVAIVAVVATTPTPTPTPTPTTTHETCVRFERFDVCHSDTTSH